MTEPIPEYMEWSSPLLYKRVTFLAKIEESTAISGEDYRWKYELQPGYLEGPIDSFTFTERGGTLDGINIAELDNTATNVGGVNPADLPTGFDFQACTGYVICFPSRMKIEGTSIEPLWTFCMQLYVDGEC